jgi:threonine aldolase
MIEAVQAANEGHVTAYGEDAYTAALQQDTTHVVRS